MKNSCKITFEGLNAANLLSALCRENISVLSFEREGKRCALQVPASCGRHTIAILRKRCYNILGVEFFGWSKIKKFLKNRMILPICCALAMVALALMSQFCFRIDVTGDFDATVVREVLMAEGVCEGTNMRAVNFTSLQNAVANRLGAVYATITRSGSVLYVNAVAAKTILPPLDMRTSRNLTASRSGKVVGVVCEQGNLLVKVGDQVQKGDVLIRGKRVFNDGTEEDVYALGRIRLQITAEGFAPFDGTREEMYQTGNVFKATGVVLFGKEYVKACPFEHYTTETTVTNLFPLNMQIRTNVYRENKTRRVNATMEECLEELKHQAYVAATEVCDFEISDCKYEVTELGVRAILYGEIQIE